jgi:hypothetical protein
VSDDVSIPNASYTARRAGRYGRSRAGISPDNRRLLLYAGGLGGVLIAMVTASTLTSRHSGPLPVVEADSRPIRVKPENPGGMKIDAAESDVFSGGSSATSAQLAPAAETPNPNGLQSAPKPKLASGAPMTAPTMAPQAKAPVTAPDATPAKSTAVPMKAQTAAPAAASSTPAAAKPTVVASALPAPAAATKAASAAAHATTVQLAAMTSEAAAKDEWQKLVHQMPDVLGSHQPTIVKAERDGRTYWRLRTTGFTDLAQARTFCEKVRGKGGSCSVADF